jgi:hypothetical protein
MVGEIEKPLVIGKAAKPRCFRNLKIYNLPVIWRNNKKAWMDAATMEKWLNMFNAKMKKENINVIFFLTMLPATQSYRLVHSKCNKCIIAHGYGCYLHIQIALQTISDALLISNVDETDSSYALARSVLVLDAMNWIGFAVKKIKAETIKRVSLSWVWGK